jgi:ketosteroid isomerase-like protein
MAKKRVQKKTTKAVSMSLARRVAELEDREAIRSLVNDMNWMADEGRLDDLLDCFTDDLVYDVGAFGTYKGKPALRGFYEQTVKAFTLRIHYKMNQVIELRGGKAKSRCYWKAELELHGRALNSSGHYLDELVKQRGRWKVAKRTATITYMCPLDEGWAKTRMMTLG